jgi:hypothetical protein
VYPRAKSVQIAGDFNEWAPENTTFQRIDENGKWVLFPAARKGLNPEEPTIPEILKKQGYAGNSLGERLKSIAPSQLESLQDAWEAHKVRNNIAHQGADFILTQRLAQETITKYQRVFTEFGVT